MNPSLYEKIGGKETVVKAAKFLYVNVLRDERLKFDDDEYLYVRGRMLELIMCLQKVK